MKFLMVGRAAGKTGANGSALHGLARLARELAGLGHETHLAIVHDRGPLGRTARVDASVSGPRLFLHELPAPRSSGVFQKIGLMPDPGAPALRLLLTRLEPEVLHLHGVSCLERLPVGTVTILTEGDAWESALPDYLAMLDERRRRGRVRPDTPRAVPSAAPRRTARETERPLSSGFWSRIGR